MSCTFRDRVRAFVHSCVRASRSHGWVRRSRLMVKFGLPAPAVRHGSVLLKRSCCGIRSATTYEKLQSSESRPGKQALDPNDKRWLWGPESVHLKSLLSPQEKKNVQTWPDLSSTRTTRLLTGVFPAPCWMPRDTSTLFCFNVGITATASILGERYRGSQISTRTLKS